MEGGGGGVMVMVIDCFSLFGAFIRYIDSNGSIGEYI